MQMTVEENPILQSPICDLSIESVLDTGFLNKFEIVSQTHSHSCYELIVNIDGEFFVDIAGSEPILLTPRAICMIPPGVYHCMRSTVAESRKLAIRFHCAQRITDDQEQRLYETYCAAFSGRTAFIVPDSEGMLFKLLHQIWHELRSPKLATQIYIKTLLKQFYILLIRIVCDQQKIGTDANDTIALQRTRWLKIEDFLNAHYADPITEGDLAQTLFLSRRQLSRVLKQVYHTSFRQLLIDMRLNRAAQLLTSTNLSVQEVSDATGYSSLSGFYSAFRRKYGVAPGAYKANTCENGTWRDK